MISKPNTEKENHVDEHEEATLKVSNVELKKHRKGPRVGLGMHRDKPCIAHVLL